MTKISRNLHIFGQKCICHMLNLIVKKFLKREESPRYISEYSFDVSNSEQNQESEIEQVRESYVRQNPLEDDQTIVKNVVRKIRFLSKKIKLNSTIQDSIQQKEGVRINLQLDSAIRWSSTLLMIKRFSDVYYILQNYLPETEKLQENERCLLSWLIQSLQAFEDAQMLIEEEKANIGKAEKVILSLLDTLSSINNVLSNPLSKLVYEYYQQYRSKQYVSISLYLDNLQLYLELLDKSIFPLLSISECEEFIISRFSKD